MDRQLTMIKATLLIALLSVIPFPLNGQTSAAGAESIERVESKLLSEADRQPWLTQMQSELKIEGKEKGPFGLAQDLTVKKVVQATRKAVKSDAFPKAIAAMKISVVLGKSFFIGGQEFKQGGTYLLERKGNKFNIKVSLVAVDQIIFQNTDTNEQVVKQLNALPAGFERDQGFDSVPGVTPANGGSGKIELDD